MKKGENPQSRKPKKVHLPYTVGVRLDEKTMDLLDLVTIYERKRRSQLVRDIVIQRLREFSRNPQFVRFIKQLEKERTR